MDDLFNFTVFLPVIGVLEVLTIVLSILFMHYSAKYRNQQLSLAWYICGVLFGFWTLIIFLIKRKDFPGPNTKVCSQCGKEFADSFQICSDCLIELPTINEEEKKKEKKLSKVFGILIIIMLIAAVTTGIIWGATMTDSIIDSLDDMSIDYIERIPVDGIYYDKTGESYNDDQSVLLYDKDGKIYSFSVEEVVNEEDEFFSYNEYYYVSEDGEKYFIYDCYVTEDGWFYCDKGGLLELFEEDTSSMTEEELDEYYNNLMELYDKEYKYYDYPYADNDGNIYYRADEASWNEKGELITAENDIVK